MRERNKESFIPQEPVLPENATSVESYTESAPERESAHTQTQEQRGLSAGRGVSSTTQTTQEESLRAPDPELQAIETILASGLDGFFMGLSPDQQMLFKREGESTAIKIREALHRQTTKIKDIVNLIIAWLKKLPGINAFFLEQEAKIKADALMRKYRS